MTSDEQHGRRRRRLAVATAVLLVLAGAVALVVGLGSQQHAPQPPAPVASAPPAPTTAPAVPVTPAAPPPAATGTVPPLEPAGPVHLDIPAIGVSSDLIELGLASDGTVEVPPLSRDSKAGWYRGSPSPGALGPAVVLGHVDSAEYGPGVFFRLGALRPGDAVTVTRTDHTAALFRVDRVASYPKDRFPTLDVYGNTDDAELRLITCGGAFDSATRNYLNNIVVYASLAGSSPA